LNLIGKVLSNRYEILEEVGIGGMATVYKAKCNLLNRYVAVKVLKDEFAKDAEFVKRFRAEAQSAAALTHPNIVSVYDVGEENGINYIVMELLTGDTLKDYIERNGKLSNETTLKFASQIASALEAAHSNKIIHRDIKPQNIVLANNNTIAKVTDFGIAKMSSKDTITSSSSTIGSVHYFSPEHAKGCYTDEKSDIYSLGVVMYEMATGVLPFNADTPVTVALKQIQENPIEPKEIVETISESLNRIILKAMAKSTADRYQSATELLDDIFAAINNKDEAFSRLDKSFADGSTQIIPIIGLKTEDKPSIGDERPSEVIESRKSQRVGKTLEEIEKEKNEKKLVDSLNENKKTKSKKAKKVTIIIAVCLAVLVIGVLVGKMVMTAIENNKKPVVQVEVVPNLVGENYEDMKTKYAELGISIKVSKYEENKDVEAGYIISQNLEADSKLVGKTIEVVVSKGVKKIEMIGAVGRDYTVAKYELEAIGFKVEVKYVVSDKIAKDIVMAQSIKEKEQVVVGTTVTLEVSEGDGKVRVIMPSVIGKTEASARSTLEKKNLKVSISYVNDIKKSDGIVVTQSVKENAEIVEGTIVELTINRLEKTKTVTIKLSEYAEGIEDESISVKVKAQVEGVTNTIHSNTHTKTETGFDDFTVDVNGFSSAKLTVFINDVEVKTLTVAF